MGGFNAISVILTDEQKEILNTLAKGRTNEFHLVQRSNIILLAFYGLNNRIIAERVSCSLSTVQIWRKRWAESSAKIKIIEEKKINILKSSIVELLSDISRPGAPPTFTDEQIAKIISLSCESPENSGIPISHWTTKTLTKEVISRKIVNSISPSHIGRLLKRRQK